MPETIVVGLDGANWDLLRPWLEDGKLPNLGSLRRNGVAEDLQSCLPPVTCPNWRCYSTGKNPGKLGVYWWEAIDVEDRSLSTPTSRSFRSADVWDYLNDAGYSTGIVNLPMTYPPFDVDGFMVAGGPGSEQESYATPAALGNELDAAGYRVHPDVSVTSADDTEAAADVVELIDDRLDAFRDLIDERPVDVAHCTVFYLNVLQHYFWRSDPTLEAWQRVDDHLGEIRAEHPDATLFLVSDHGCAEIDTVFYANSWLEREGYLSTTTTAGSLLERVGINQERASALAARFGLRDALVRLTPAFVERIIPEGAEGAKREQKLDRVDWDESRAIASGQGLVYTIDDAGETRDEVIDGLAELESAITGEPIAREVHRREDAYVGPYVDAAPDVVFDQTPGVHTSGAIGENPVFDDAGHWRAENVRTGLFLADGPAVTGSFEGPASITDVAPTILHSLGCAVPEDVDGDPLPLFGCDPPETRPPIVPEYAADRADERVEERLEDLGYLQ